MITSNPLTPPRIAQAKGAKRQSAVAAVGTGTVGAKTVGAKTKDLETGEQDARRPVIIEIFKR